MYHSLFIHSSPDGCLGCFQILAIVNSTAIKLTHSFPAVHKSCFLLPQILCIYVALHCSTLNPLHLILSSQYSLLPERSISSLSGEAITFLEICRLFKTCFHFSIYFSSGFVFCQLLPLPIST